MKFKVRIVVTIVMGVNLHRASSEMTGKCECALSICVSHSSTSLNFLSLGKLREKR